MSDTALAISFLNGNLEAVARACRDDGALAVRVLLEVQRLGHRDDGARFARALEAVPNKVRQSRKNRSQPGPPKH